MPVKVFYIISDIEKALAFEWINDFIDSDKIELHFILIGKTDTPLIKFLRHRGTPHHVISYATKKDLLKTWLAVFGILRKEKPDVVHTHLWVANLVGLSAAWVSRVSRRIYTRHHALVHHRQYPSGLKWDKLENRLATNIVAISKSIVEILVDWDKAQKKKITIIHHGFDLPYFSYVDEERVTSLRKKYNLNASNHPVVGVISRYTNWKGVQFIIPAFKSLLSKYPNGHLVLANAKGEYAREIKTLLNTLPQGSYTEIGFEGDLTALYRLFNVYVHVPIDAYSEAFGQTYVEALATGTPSVFTLSGIAREFIRDRENAVVVEYKNSEQIFLGLCDILENEELSKKLIIGGRESIQQFSIGKYMQELETLYLHR